MTPETVLFLKGVCFLTISLASIVAAVCFALAMYYEFIRPESLENSGSEVE